MRDVYLFANNSVLTSKESMPAKLSMFAYDCRGNTVGLTCKAALIGDSPVVRQVGDKHIGVYHEGPLIDTVVDHFETERWRNCTNLLGHFFLNDSFDRTASISGIEVVSAPSETRDQVLEFADIENGPELFLETIDDLVRLEDEQQTYVGFLEVKPLIGSLPQMKFAGSLIVTKIGKKAVGVVAARAGDCLYLVPIAAYFQEFDLVTTEGEKLNYETDLDLPVDNNDLIVSPDYQAEIRAFLENNIQQHFKYKSHSIFSELLDADQVIK